ncbi:MAG: NUDIX domain-containing protein [Ignavibacteriaceae bacterium]|nr:NUDIX domain-containing protein [Ignavibacteriaceae bacterium]
MTKNISAGLLMFSRKNGLKVFLIHPGGPFFAKKDDDYWGIPKGLTEENEDHLQAAVREFEEETGIKPAGEFIPLGTIVQKGGKVVYGWAFECPTDDAVTIKSNTCQVEWPPRSGKKIIIPEVDKGEFFSIENAKVKMKKAQQEFLDRLLSSLDKDK